MATTTFEAIRATQISVVEALTPTLQSNVKFLVSRAESDFRLWSVENPQACFRRFSVVDLFDYDAPAVSNTDVEWVEGREEIIIAYPEDFRYGGDNFRDLRDLVRSDQYQIDNSLGHRGTGNYTDAHAILETASIEDDDAVSFLTLSYLFRFYRSV